MKHQNNLKVLKNINLKKNTLKTKKKTLNNINS